MTDTTINKNPKKITLKIYPLDILIYQRVKYFTEQKDGFCYESNISLSKQFNRSTQRISSSIQKLIRLEYLKNDGTIQQRQLKITDKPLNYYFNKNDIDFNKNDIDFNKINATTLTQILLHFNKNDMMTLTKAIGDFNKNDNRVLDIILDINKERNKDISSKENTNTCFAKKENEIEVNKYKSIENLKISQIYKWEDLILFWDKNKSGTKYKNKDTLDIALNKLKQISENKIEIARNIIETSIMNGWQGLFPLQNKSQVQQPKKCGIPDGII
ncbi:hypothetical protein EOM09_01955 [bacterium]|nr:hypothetical protein [bacterium]